MTKPLIVPVILCGGSGTRLWPASREKHPKQFLNLMNDFSLLQNTMRRALRVCGADASSLVTVTLGKLKNSVSAHIAEIDENGTKHILCEPAARNTAAAVAFAAEYVSRNFGEDAILWILPADHHIADENILGQSLCDALDAARAGKLVTFGITPTRADTGYGYIRAKDAPADKGVMDVAEFVEKPNLATAEKYIADGNYLWNSGMFLFTAQSVLAHYAELAPNILSGVRRSMQSDAQNPCADTYTVIEQIPFDKAIMEKSKNAAVVPCNPQWSDIGSWESLWDIMPKDKHNNVVQGKAALHNAQGCLVQSKDRLIAIAGLDNIVVVESGDAILIADKTDADSMKALVTRLKTMGAPEAIDPPSAQPQQPWTMVKSLNSDQPFHTREITIKAGQKKTFDAHDTGMCLYTVLEGKAAFSINGNIKTLAAFESMNVQTTAGYAIINRGTTDLKMIEVQKSQSEGVFFGKTTASNESKKVA